MPERSSVVEVTQLGREATPGTAVAATVRPTTFDVLLAVEDEVDRYKPAGYKADTLVSPVKEWTSAEVKGRPSYNEMVYLLSMLFPFTNPSVTDGNNAAIAAAKAWQFRPSSTALDTVLTYTTENGQAFRGHRAPYVLLSELGYKFDRGATTPDLSGGGFGQLLQDGITMSAGATEVAGGGVPILQPQIDVFLDPTGAALGTTQMTRAKSVEWKLGDRQKPLWVLDSSKSSWVSPVEGAWDSTMVLMVEADAAGMALLTTQFRQGSTAFVRVRGRGPTIAAAPAGGGYKIGGGALVAATTLPNIFQHDFAGKVEKIGKFEDSDGTRMISFTLRSVHDSTLGYATQILLVNTLTAVL